MGDAVIYAWREEQGDVWTGEWALDRKDKWVPAEANKYILATPEALAASPEVQALMQPDADLLLDAYRALLVLHRVLDKAGLTRGAETAENIADRIVAAHPEIPARSAIRAEAAAIRGETP